MHLDGTLTTGHFVPGSVKNETGRGARKQVDDALAHDVSAEVKGWSNRKAHCVPGAFQNIGEQAIMHEIRLQANACISEQI